MTQMTTWPVELFCQRRSGLPSALKSPLPTTCHGAGTFAMNTLEERLVPFISHA